jgi:agmatinase
VIHSHGNPMRMITSLDTVDRIIQVGIRSFRTHQQDVLDSLGDGNTVVTVKQARDLGPEGLARLLPKGRPVYVSIDIDSLDPSIMPATSTPEPSGFTYDELRDNLAALAQHVDIVGFDLVEVNPMVDSPTSLTSFIAVQLIVEFLGQIVEQPGYRARHPRRDEGSQARG